MSLNVSIELPLLVLQSWTVSNNKTDTFTRVQVGTDTFTRVQVGHGYIYYRVQVGTDTLTRVQVGTDTFTIGYRWARIH